MTGRLFTHTATIRGHRGIPVRREGCYWWAAFEVALGIVWASRALEHLVELAEPIDATGVRSWRRDGATGRWLPVLEPARAG